MATCLVRSLFRSGSYISRTALGIEPIRWASLLALGNFQLVVPVNAFLLGERQTTMENAGGPSVLCVFLWSK